MIDVESVKRKINIVDYALQQHIEFADDPDRPKRQYLVFCPFHTNTRTPAMALYPETNSFNCFSCKAAGDILTFIQMKEGLDFFGAIEYINGNRDGITRTAAERRQGAAKKVKKQAEHEHTEAYCSTCQREPNDLGDFIEHAIWHRKKEDWIVSWWQARGVRVETLDSLQLGGYVNGRSWATLPIITPEGDVIGARKRSTSGNKAYRPWRAAEPTLDRPYAIYTSDTPKFFTVVEGEIKNIVLAQFLADHGYEVCALTGFGAKTWRPEWAQYITGELIVIPDPSNGVDEAGEMYEERVLASVDFFGRSVHLPMKVDDMINAGRGDEVLRALNLRG